MSDKTIKAIETRYKGYRFRSRLEARWAVFFETLGLDWKYEPEGFLIDQEDGVGDPVPYLPDFWIPFKERQSYEAGTPPISGAWIEIKPVLLTGHEESLCANLSRQSRHVCLAFAGQPWLGEFAFYKWHFNSHPLRNGLSQLPDQCWYCQGAGHEIELNLRWRKEVGRYFNALCVAPCSWCRNAKNGGPIDQSQWNYLIHNTGGILYHLMDKPDDGFALATEAFRAARSARFEHGETPS